MSQVPGFRPGSCGFIPSGIAELVQEPPAPTVHQSRTKSDPDRVSIGRGRGVLVSARRLFPFNLSLSLKPSRSTVELHPRTEHDQIRQSETRRTQLRGGDRIRTCIRWHGTQTLIRRSARILNLIVFEVDTLETNGTAGVIVTGSAVFPKFADTQ